MDKTLDQLQLELDGLYAKYDNLLETSSLCVNELLDKVEGLRKTCEFLSNTNCGLLGDLTTTAVSRQRILNQLPEKAAWAERALASFEKTAAAPTTQTNPDYNEFFQDA
jgi:hypothetical protein